MYTAVLFDLDGTLVDSYPGLTEAVNGVLVGVGQRPLSLAAVRALVGHGARRLLSDALGRTVEDEEMDEFGRLYQRTCRTGTRLLPEARETLVELRALGYGLGVATNKPSAFTGPILSHLELAELLGSVASADEVARPKPAPDVLVRAIEALGQEPSHCLYVGDMDVDVRTARAAGTAVWVVPGGSSSRAVLERSRPDRLIEGLSELVERLPPVR